MAAAAASAPVWRRLAAPDRHPPEPAVHPALSRSAVRRPASTIRGQTNTLAAAAAI
jgi:hypothetical protein